MSQRRDSFPSSDAPGTAKAKRPKLSKAQLERKRECDREAQRQIRLKTKNRIAHLESLVQTLQEGHNDQGRMTELVGKLNESQQEITRLKEIIRGVMKMVEGVDPTHVQMPRGDKGSDIADSLPQYTQPNDDHDMLLDELQSMAGGSQGSPVVFRDTIWNEQIPFVSPDPETTDRSTHLMSPRRRSSGTRSSNSIPEQHSVFEQDCNQGDEVFGQLPARRESDLQLVSSNAEQRDITKKINTIAAQIIHDRRLDGRLWYLAGSLLTFILGMPQKYQTPMEYEEDIPVRAVLHGWGNVSARYYLDPGWLWLRHLDEALYSALGVPERLSIMRVMRMQYQAQVRPHLTSDLPLPAFMTARPAQTYMEHDPLVEHFVWPGMREHILFGPRKYATNKFMDAFRNHVRFVWNYNPEDTFNRDDATGMYSYTAHFTSRQTDLRCWSMKSDFFNLFPELRNDIPSFNDSPSNLNLALPLVRSRGSPRLYLENGKVHEEPDEDRDPLADCHTVRSSSFSYIGAGATDAGSRVSAFSR